MDASARDALYASLKAKEKENATALTKQIVKKELTEEEKEIQAKLRFSEALKKQQEKKKPVQRKLEVKTARIVENLPALFAVQTPIQK